MECPNGHPKLEKILFHNVEVEYCHECIGIWFNAGELVHAKDDRDNELNWLDFDIWRDKARFVVNPDDKRCPVCRIPFVEISYDDSSVKVDFCKRCKGVWLDRGEFKQIMVYLKKKADYEILHHYIKNLVVQLWEVFAGPQSLREELADFLMVTKLLKYKFVTQHPLLEAMIESLPK